MHRHGFSAQLQQRWLGWLNGASATHIYIHIKQNSPACHGPSEEQMGYLLNKSPWGQRQTAAAD